MAETHELRLKIDAGAAQRGARQFTSAIAAVKKAVSDLDRDTTGAFTKLRSIRPEIDVSPITRATAETKRLAATTDAAANASDRAAATIKRTALASASALRTSEQAAQRLALRIGDLGDARGLMQLEVALQRLRSGLVSATSRLDVRAAKSQFDDLRSSLLQSTVAAEHARGEQAQLAREMEEASRAAAAHGETLDRLRAKYNPLYSASKQYESALEEISFAEREGAISAQMAEQARARAAQTLGAASAAADQYSAALARNSTATSQGVMVGYQLQDVLITSQMGFQSVGMIALQQGSQLAAQMNMLKASGGGVFKTLLAGFTSLVNPISLVTIAGTAAIAMLAKWAFSAADASNDTARFEDALKGLSDAHGDFESAASSAGTSLADLTKKYGTYATSIRDANAALKEHAYLAELESISTAAAAITDSFGGMFDAMARLESTDLSGRNFRSVETNLRNALEAAQMNVTEAERFRGALDALGTANGPKETLRAMESILAAMDATYGSVQAMPGPMRDFHRAVEEARGTIARMLGLQEGTTGELGASAGAASDLTYTIGTAADEAARLLANLGSVPSALAVMGKSVEGQIAAIQAENRSLSIQLEEGWTSAAANRRVQLETMVSTAAERGQRINFDQVASEYQSIQELERLGKEQAALRDRISEANRPARTASSGSGGGARVEQLTAEQQAMSDLNSSLQERLRGIEAENLALQNLANGTVQSTEAAQALAEAQLATGGAVDAQTAAMIRQIDAAAQLHEQLTSLANDPVKDWMDSVPNWIEAGQQIEMGVVNALSDAISNFIKTGKFDFESLGESILGTVADIVADKAVKELLSLFGREDGQGLGGLFGGLFNSVGDTPAATGTGADVAQGGMQAGQTISTAMVQAGQTVAQNISMALTQGATSVSTQAQTGLTMGANNVRMAGQQGLAMGAANIQTASANGGQVLGQGVVTGAQQGAPILSSAVAGGAAGGMPGMGGSGIGGTLLNLGVSLLGGLFSEGGMSTSAVAHTSVPVSAFRNAPHYAQGTPNTSGIPAILHDNEAVIPLSRGRKIPVDLGGVEGAGGQVLSFNPTYNITTPDSDSFRRSQSQTIADGYSAAQKAAAKNR